MESYVARARSQVDCAPDPILFSPTTPDQNCETVGVSAANINGVVGVGRAP